VNIQTKQNNESHLPQTVLGFAGAAGVGFALRKGVTQLYKPYYKGFMDNLDKFTPQECALLVQEANRMIEESDIVKNGFNGINWIDTNKKSMPLKRRNIIKNELNDIKDSKSLIKPFLMKIIEHQELPISKSIIEIADKLDPPSSNVTGKISTKEAVNKFTGGILRISARGSLKDRLKLSFLAIASPLVKLADLLTGNIQNKKRVRKLLKSVTNGCFDPFSNRIFTAKPASVLHEIGHAINKNTSFLTRIPQNLTLISKGALIPLAILTAILTKKPQKLDNEETNNKSSFKKLKEFVHNHIGLTLAGLSVPLLIEEGLASSRAIKFVNSSKTLSETIKNQHNKVLKMAYGSYLIGTAILVCVASLTVFVKDKIIKHTVKSN